MEAQTLGIFNYMSPESESSLFRNGKVLTRRDLVGTDSSWEGVNFKKQEVSVSNARSSINATLDVNGFELLDHDVEEEKIEFFENKDVLKRYYPMCSEVIRAATGARAVFAFDHNIRSAAGKKSKKMITGGQQVQGPAHTVHGDYTLTSAPERLKQLAKVPGKNDTIASIMREGEALIPEALVDEALGGGRFAIINLWRNIVAEPVEINPLALCDASRVSPEDLVVFEIHYADRVGENYFAKYNPAHSWYFYPRMTRSEALLIKQWDSDGGLSKSGGAKPDAASPGDPCTFSFHSAFSDPNTRDDAPDRWSIEVRCAVIY